MTWSLVVVRESVTIVTDPGGRFVEMHKLHRDHSFSAAIDLPFAKHRMERILREDVLDICDEQFLVLLLMMNAEDKDRLDFIQ